MKTSPQPAREKYSDRRCRNCGSFVTPEFTRVFGNNDDEVFGCLDCMSATAVKNGKARAENITSPQTTTNYRRQ